MGKLGVPTAKDVDALVKRVDALAAAVAKLSKAAPAKAPRAAKAVKAAAAKAGRQGAGAARPQDGRGLTADLDRAAALMRRQTCSRGAAGAPSCV